MTSSEREILSSRMTWFYKFGFPTLWISGFGFGTLMLWVSPGTFTDRNGVPPESGMQYMFLIVWIIGSIFLVGFTSSLKHVTRDGEALFISNGRREIRVPFTDIARVSFRWWMNPSLVVLSFRDDIPFGRSISFLPRTKATGWLRNKQPLVDELRALAHLE